MKHTKKILSAIIAMALLFLNFSFLFANADEADGGTYYVCFSSQNYAVRNSNKMTYSNGEYVLKYRDRR